jgi:hypothetical protein
MNEGYRRARESLVVGARFLDRAGMRIEIRNCLDRVEGRLDPRNALILGLPRKEFEEDFSRYDKELRPNGIRIPGPGKTEGRTGLEIFPAG